jgi:hypothetical protein
MQGILIPEGIACGKTSTALCFEDLNPLCLLFGMPAEHPEQRGIKTIKSKFTLMHPFVYIPKAFERSLNLNNPYPPNLNQTLLIRWVVV